MKDFIKKNKNRILMSFFVVVIVIGLFIKYVYDKKIYNHGVCPFCEGHYEYQTTVGAKNGGHSVVYKCDKCGHIIEIGFYGN